MALLVALGDGEVQWYRLLMVPILLRTEMSARIIANAIIFPCLFGFFGALFFCIFILNKCK